ncbi:YheC/D-like protein [Melghirimyces profundicolus]|uniref:YheC/D-like protein n=1 Tax=Melghirimyces profundicolus TaxID=1242148 RepID=A0A2T6C4R0_9BACL|nr:YheC/YheD family protein [Melghirimyces profundicolus]PTX63267.1 YheC/D-like protein [Melghirimyces profundicolus]
MSPTVYTLGVISCRSAQKTPPFQETEYLRALTKEGKPQGIRLITFTPMEVDWNTKVVTAWRYDLSSGKWKKERHPLPPLIYDRCYYLNTRQYLAYKPYVSRIAQCPGVQLLGKPLGGKLQTHEMLQKNRSLVPYLSPTFRLRSPTDILLALEKNTSVLIKPNGGSHGRGVAAITPEGSSYRVRGRSIANRCFHLLLPKKKALIQWARRFTGQTRYIIQPYLQLTTGDGRPFDLRILVQKDQNGSWTTTGMAVRTGNPNSLTSNLHGGGKAEKALPFLKKHYPPTMVSKILDSIRFLSTHIPKEIERQHGRLLELGLDVGIDRQGRVWFLEANSKPGRSVFLLTGEKEIRRRSVQMPVQYALSLFRSLTGGSV